jgi:hypothetical protein
MYMPKGTLIDARINRYNAGELLSLRVRPFLVSLFPYLVASAIGAVSIAVTVACIAALVNLALVCLCSKIRFLVESQHEDVDTINE